MSAKPLADTRRDLEDPRVRLAVEGSRPAVRTTDAQVALPPLDLGPHPGVPVLPPVTGSMPARTLATTLAAVSSAAPKDDAIPLFTGVRVHGTAS
ncbi:hypothetical protein [Saccharothrix lopnurensis]|uniref:Uncharacterized protein n=1 Tax=Saccharothrix lopnurensis TaxID=1670621 RepID=A0ABW1NY52_9PSEU